ncbi:uncharacterized protein EI90DRAFT_3064111, partial [Cantharellus anzutake]|uniref:uncharacterized protein n=1 Tax=Cantharellus anzutake TaxID=1750568 RepID=UPI001904D024
MSDRQWGHDGYEQQTYDDYDGNGYHNSRGGGSDRDWRQNSYEHQRSEGDWKRRKTDGDGHYSVSNQQSYDERYEDHTHRDRDSYGHRRP